MTDVAVDTYIREMPPLPDDQPWQDALYNHCRASRDVHRNDQILSDLLFIRTSTYTRYATRRVFEVEEAAIRMLVDGGFTAENAFMVYNAASIYMRGMIIHDRILRLSDTPTLDDRQRRMIDWSTMPLLESQIDRHPLRTAQAVRAAHQPDCCLFRTGQPAAAIALRLASPWVATE